MRWTTITTVLITVAAVTDVLPWLDIVLGSNASLVRKAAQQLQRYLYVYDRRLPLAAIVSSEERDSVFAQHAPFALYLTTGDLQSKHPSLGLQGGFHFDVELAPERFILVGSDDAGAHVMHGVWTILSRLGVRATAEGVLLPPAATMRAQIAASETTACATCIASDVVQALIQGGSIVAAPVFEYRGLQPWGSYPIGNDWWDVDEYRRVVELISGLRGNWIGMHDYANNYQYPEPGVAVIGDATGLQPDGNLSAGGVAYTGTWAASERPSWGLDGASTASYAFGATALFDWDCFANRAVAGGVEGLCPTPSSPEGVAETFNRVGALYASVFSFATELGISTALGTELPLAIPPSNDTLIPLLVWWSTARNDTFVTTTQCAECLGLYVLLGTCGWVYAGPGPGRVPLSSYWAPGYLDAMLAAAAPSDPAYSWVRIEGYALADNGTGLLPVVQEARDYDKEGLGQRVDTWAVAGAAFSANASARGYIDVTPSGPMGFIFPAGKSPQDALEEAYNATLTRMALLYGENLTWYWGWTAEGWQWDKVQQNDPAVAAVLGEKWFRTQSMRDRVTSFCHPCSGCRRH